MMLFKSKQEGFTLVELIVGIAITAAVLGFSFKTLVGLRQGVQGVSTTAPHVHFESFAVSRLKVFFAKLMQWNTHVCANGDRDIGCLCKTAGYFAYAPNEVNLTNSGGLFASQPGFSDDTFIPKIYCPEDSTIACPNKTRINNALANVTLAADLRLALSTFSQQDIAPNGMAGNFFDLTDLARTKGANPAAAPWGAMIPIHFVDEWRRANLMSRNWCASPDRRPAAGTIGDEMCKAFESCTQVAGGLGGGRPANQLGWQNGGITDIRGLEYVSMCFVFAGNLFSRTQDFIDQSTGLAAIDNPAVVGLAVAQARFVNNTNLQPMNCRDAAMEMNRSLKITVTLYSALNVDQTKSKKQFAQKSVREITAEKLGIPIPNCQAPNRGGLSAVGQGAKCIEDPTWIYECRATCTYP